MSLFADYINERGTKHIVESDKGFATYLFDSGLCYIEDLYVVPEHRKSGEASRLADEISNIAKKKGCRQLLGSVVPTANGSTDSCKVLFAYGFRLLKTEHNQIWFIKDLE